jgi:hypothetical protein
MGQKSRSRAKAHATLHQPHEPIEKRIASPKRRRPLWKSSGLVVRPVGLATVRERIADSQSPNRRMDGDEGGHGKSRDLPGMNEIVAPRMYADRRFLTICPPRLYADVRESADKAPVAWLPWYDRQPRRFRPLLALAAKWHRWQASTISAGYDGSQTAPVGSHRGCSPASADGAHGEHACSRPHGLPIRRLPQWAGRPSRKRRRVVAEQRSTSHNFSPQRDRGSSRCFESTARLGQERERSIGAVIVHAPSISYRTFR